jgi:protein O-mannosyl-transferase
MIQLRDRSSAWPFAAVVLAAIAFAPALWAGFVYDDLRDVVGNPAARAESFLVHLTLTLRPLLKASYALQDALTGMSAPSFHAVNLGLHLGSIPLVFILIRRAASLSGDAKAANRLAGIATLLWAVHPALADTVAYVSGRSMGLSGVLTLACLVAATTDRPRQGLAFTLACLAPLARETALVTPLLLLAWQITISREPPPQALRRAAPVWLGALVAALIIAALARHRELVAFSLDQRGPLDALRGNLFAIPEILRLWVMPWQISILPTQPVVYGWTDPQTLGRAALLVGVAVSALSSRRRAPLLVFAVLWTLITLMPTNSLIWRMEPVAVRPLYLAGIGMALGGALVLARLPFGTWVAVALALGLAGMTWQRAALYQDETALFADAAAKAPMDARAQMMLGLTLANAGQLDKARAALKTALQLDPFQTEAANALRLLDAAAPIYRPPP